MSIPHIAYPHDLPKSLYSYHWKAICGDPTAVMFNLYPQYAHIKGAVICEDCLNHPDYALILLGAL